MYYRQYKRKRSLYRLLQPIIRENYGQKNKFFNNPDKEMKRLNKITWEFTKALKENKHLFSKHITDIFYF